MSTSAAAASARRRLMKRKRSSAQRDDNDHVAWDAVITSPTGAITVGIKTSGVYLDKTVYLQSSTELKEPDSSNKVAYEAARQLQLYFSDSSHIFDFKKLLFNPSTGTSFQKRVWRAMTEIPTGQVVTYGQMAKNIGCKSSQAVGQACGANSFAPLVPCHRVVAASGIGGFANEAKEGFYRDTKIWLLRHEKVTAKDMGL